MTGFDKLPDELAVQVLSYLQPADLKQVCLTDPTLYSIALPLYYSQLDFDIFSILETYTSTAISCLPSAVEEYQIRVLALQYVQNLRHLNLVLVGAEESSRVSFRNSRGTNFYPVNDKHFCERHFQEQINESLATMIHSLPLYSRLTDITFKARCAKGRSCCSRSGSAFLGFTEIKQFLVMLPNCKALRSLIFDTEDAEQSTWTVPYGVGASCDTHLCPLIAQTLSSLPKLKHLTLRRRDLCCSAFDFGSSPDTLSNDAHDRPFKPCLPEMESLVLNTRLTDIQQTSDHSWEACARHCNSHCWCVKCLKGRKMTEAEERYQAIRETFRQDNKTDSQQMSQALLCSLKVALTKAAKEHMPRIRELDILAYAQPAQDMVNWTRFPVEIDCVRNEVFHSGLDHDLPCRYIVGLAYFYKHLQCKLVARPDARGN